MKKQYIIPATECIQMETIRLVANSIDKDNNGITDPNGYEFLGREDKDPKTPNLWDNEW